MANIDDVLSGKEDSFFYDDGKSKSTGKTQWKPFVEGTYWGHIVDASTRVVEWQNYKARVYNYKVKIHADTDLTLGTGYAGREIKSIGVFRYLEPTENDKFVSHPSGNRNYLSFCEALSVECPKKEKEIDGKKVEVRMLPALNLSDVNGKPVKAIVKKGKAFKDKNGDTRYYFDVKWVERWTDGEVIKTEEGDNEIPF